MTDSRNQHAINCHIYRMSSNRPWASRVLRLDALKALLAERDYTTVADLADELGVSPRTLHRDLALLREMGVPVEGDRGTGGGLRLEPGWSLGRVHLNESEALGLLLSLTIAEKVGSPLLLGGLRSSSGAADPRAAPADLGRADRIHASARRLHPTPASGHKGAARGVRAAANRASRVRGPARHDHQTGDRAPLPLLQSSRLVCPGMGPAPGRHPLFPHRPHPGRPGSTHQVPSAATRPVRSGRRGDRANHVKATKMAWSVRSKALVGRSATFSGPRACSCGRWRMPTSDRADQAGIAGQEGDLCRFYAHCPAR